LSIASDLTERTKTEKLHHLPEVEKFEKLNRKLIRIRNYASSRFDDLRMWGLFSTKPGRRFKKQMREVSNFVFACCLLTLPFGELQDEWLRTIKSGEFRKLRSITNSRKDFDMMLSKLETLADLLGSSNSKDVGYIMGKQELQRFLGLLAISAFAYLDAYADAIVETITQDSELRKVVMGYLQETEVYNNRNKTAVTTLKHVRNLGISQRLLILEESFKAKEQSIGIFSESEYNRYSQLVKYFIQLRGDIVHNNPAPSLRKFDHEFFKSNRKEVREALFTIFQEFTFVPDPLKKQFEIIERWLNKLLPTFTIIFTIPKMIVGFVALLDSVIDAHS
jgi:hypothetical protein